MNKISKKIFSLVADIENHIEMIDIIGIGNNIAKLSDENFAEATNVELVDDKIYVEIISFEHVVNEESTPAFYNLMTFAECCRYKARPDGNISMCFVFKAGAD